MKLIIEDDEGRKTVVPFVREEITIGRQEGNTIRLTERNVSRRHARLIRHNGSVVVEDLGSYNGIKINGERIQGQTSVQDGDLIQIGDYDLAIQTESMAQLPPPTLAPAPAAPVSNGAGPHALHQSNPRIPVMHPQDAPTETATPIYEAGNENTLPRAQAPTEGGRQQSTAVIRMDQVEGAPRRQVLSLDATEAPRLFVLNTDYAGREFACIRTEIRVGRTEDNDVALDHRSLSRLHAKIVREDTGEWRILDMESANGVSVNGERYAQVSLRPGDVIELGHVKLKFLGPGESFRFIPGAYTRGTAAVKNKAVLIGGAAVAAAAIGIVIWAFAGGSKGDDPDPAPPGPSAVVTPGSEPRPPAPPDPPPTTNPPPVHAVDVDAKLRAAQAAMNNKDMGKAIDILESIKNPDGTTPARVEELLSQAREEEQHHKNILQANKEMSGGNLEEAARLLALAQNTLSFNPEYEAAKAKLEKLAKKKTGPPPKPVDPKVAEDVTKLFEDGRLLLKKRQHKEALSFFIKCLELDKANSDCHLALGSTYARLREWEKGYQHYQTFLKLSPDHERADEVRKLVKDYEDQRSKQK